MKRFTLILTVLAALLNCASAQEQPEFKFTCEPYLQNVTDTEATIVWGTSLDAISWVEIAPHDGRSFYAEEHPRFVDSYLPTITPTAEFSRATCIGKKLHRSPPTTPDKPTCTLPSSTTYTRKANAMLSFTALYRNRRSTLLCSTASW